jgi:DNA-binding PadR family transcriptional regulator
MAKRRKVSNMLALAVLSTVTIRPMHPYEMASMLREHGKDQDIKFKWGSLYTVVQNLEKHGFLEVVASGRQGGRPERTVYRITDAGRAELADWVRELMAVPEPEFPRFKAALSVVGAIGPDETIDLLRQRTVALEEQIAQMRAGLAGASAVPRLFLIEGEFDLAMREAELGWVRSLLGELTTATLPGIETWRTFHRTGDLPPEFVVDTEGGARTREDT